MAKAAILEQVGGLTIGEVELADPGPHEVLIDTKACGLCHSDLHFIDGAYPHPLPAIPGHEAAGVVRAVGSEVNTVKPGDHVVSCLSVFCGHCEFCVTGRMALCLGADTRRSADQTPRIIRSIDKTPVGQMLNLSAFCEQMLIHENACVAIDKDMPLDRAAIIGCAVTTGAGTIFNACKVVPGETVAVVGCGGVGLAAINAAKIAGARAISYAAAVAFDEDERAAAPLAAVGRRTRRVDVPLEPWRLGRPALASLECDDSLCMSTQHAERLRRGCWGACALVRGLPIARPLVRRRPCGRRGGCARRSARYASSSGCRARRATTGRPPSRASRSTRAAAAPSRAPRTERWRCGCATRAVAAGGSAP